MYLLPKLKLEFTEVHFHIHRPPFPFPYDYIRNTRAWRLWIDQRTLLFTGDSGSVRWEFVWACTHCPPVSPRWPGSWPDVYVTSERNLGEAAHADHLSLWPHITFNPLTGWLTLDSPFLSDQKGSLAVWLVDNHIGFYILCVYVCIYTYVYVYVCVCVCVYKTYTLPPSYAHFFTCYFGVLDLAFS